MPVDDRGISGEQWFPSTSWSLVVGAQSASPEDYARLMTRLAEIYWRPVYWFIRQGWNKNHDDAKDLTQEFFATVIFGRKLIDGYQPKDRGFRTFLRATIVRFMVDEHRGEARQKRGGGIPIASLDALSSVSSAALPGATNRTPEEMFDIAWNEAVLREAMALMRQQWMVEGRATEFEAFRRYDFEGESDEISHVQLAEALGLTLPQVKHALADARKTFRQIVTGIVSAYADNPEELDAELRALFSG